MLTRVQGNRTASDINEDLILMWIGIRDGTYIPPLRVSEGEYDALKTAPSSAHRGFVGIAASYSGKWFGGYARAARQDAANPEDRQWREDQYIVQARRSVLALRPALQNVNLIPGPYTIHNPSGCLIYADPPYANTTKYKAGDYQFDHDQFWQTIREWSFFNTVVVSEYTAPPDFERVYALPTHTSLRVRDPNNSIGRHDKRLESLYSYVDAPDHRRIVETLQSGRAILPSPPTEEDLFLTGAW